VTADEVSGWAGLIKHASELEVPGQVITAIQQLLVYADGLMCYIDPDHYCQIFQSEETIRKH
jgi:hypothetical protein